MYTEARKRIVDVENKVNTFGRRLDISIGIIFTAITVLVAALSIFVSSSQGVYVALPWWVYLSFGFSIMAFIISIFANAKARS